AQEQATGLSEVNTAVNQMDQVTQKNAAMVEETTAASHALAQEARLLAQSVSRFEFGGPDGGTRETKAARAA
ncbi:MAG TPA: chemotaxis protein, partial [Phenylobacterium sp.]|nr:chemotaxis protein [Phenylobacterium sp.]